VFFLVRQYTPGLLRDTRFSMRKNARRQKQSPELCDSILGFSEFKLVWFPPPNAQPETRNTRLVSSFQHRVSRIPAAVYKPLTPLSRWGFALQQHLPRVKRLQCQLSSNRSANHRIDRPARQPGVRQMSGDQKGGLPLGWSY